MDVLPKITLLSELGVANAEVRAAQAQLYEEAMKQTLTLESLKTHRHLDTDIKIVISDRFCVLKGRFEQNFHTFYIADDVETIKTGFCECIFCKKVESPEIGVAGLRLIHTLMISDKNLPLIAFLHEGGCDMNPLTIMEKCSPLLLAVSRRNTKIVKYFVRHFDRIEFTPTFQKALIESTVGLHCDANIMKMLLSSKHVSADFCEGKDSPLLIKCLEKYDYSCDSYIDLARVCLEAGANPDIADEHGNRPLMIAAKYGCVEIVRLLLKHGSDVNSTNEQGDTAMHYTVMELGNREKKHNHGLMDVGDKEAIIVQLLLENGANPDSRNKEGVAPLWKAVDKNCFNVVQTLLAASAKMEIEKTGENPEDFVKARFCPKAKSLLDKAWECADEDILQLLREAGYDIHKEFAMLKKEFPHYYRHFYKHNKYQNFFDDWISSTENPPKLEYLCRDRIRKCLGHKIHKKVEEIDLPEPLKHSLLLKHVLPSESA